MDWTRLTSLSPSERRERDGVRALHPAANLNMERVGDVGLALELIVPKVAPLKKTPTA